MLRRLFSLNLRVSFMLLILAALLPALAFTLYTYADQRQRAASDAQYEALGLAHLAADRNKQLVESTRQLLITLAKLPQTQVLRGDSATCGSLLAGLLAQN